MSELAPVPVLDVVTVYHNNRNFQEHLQLLGQLLTHADRPFHYIAEDNRVNNRGFGRACNEGAGKGSAPIIGFLNPDAQVDGPFIGLVEQVLGRPNVVITGERFGKPDREIQMWGCRDWVCGACLFVRRDWWEQVGGFHSGYVWSHEETDLIRVAQATGKMVQSIPLPIRHASPDEDSPKDAEYKRHHFDQGAVLFRQRWGTTTGWPYR